MPTMRGKNHVLAASGTTPRRENTNPMRAALDASRTSIASVIVIPKPTAGPLMAAMTGFLRSKMRSVTRPPPSRCSSGFTLGARSNVLPPAPRSAPAQNARPAPVTITARTPSSASAASKAAINSSSRRVATANGRATVEKIAINAVMAGCRPDFMPVVVAGVRAMCDDAFDLVGISGTTDAVAPVFIVNGPVRAAIGLNCAAGALGPGSRANATIGRALRLVWANLGGARPGVISMSTFGNPARYACCFGEHQEASPWEPLHVEHGFARDESTVAPRGALPRRLLVGPSRTRRPAWC